MIEKLVDHMHWADARILAWLGEDANRTDEQMRLVSHILNVERVWISRAGGEQGDRDIFKVRSLEELAALETSNHADFRALLGTDVKRVIDYRLFSGAPVRSSVEDMLLHAFSHGFHHVGQVAVLAAASGRSLPDLSYLGFSRSKAV